MVMKFFLDTILLLYIYGFEGYLSRYKIDEMVNNLRIAVNSSNFIKICANIAKDHLQYVTVSAKTVLNGTFGILRNTILKH